MEKFLSDHCLVRMILGTTGAEPPGNFRVWPRLIRKTAGELWKVATKEQGLHFVQSAVLEYVAFLFEPVPKCVKTAKVRHFMLTSQTSAPCFQMRSSARRLMMHEDVPNALQTTSPSSKPGIHLICQACF